MHILDGIRNFLQIINDNWTTIIIIIALILSIAKKVKDFFEKSNDEKFAIAKKQIQETILKYITDAELDYDEWTKAGGIKRSQVMKEIFEKYPILSKITDQEELIIWIDEVIDNALETLRDIIAKNAEE